jgi:hypothetical protein
LGITMTGALSFSAKRTRLSPALARSTPRPAKMIGLPAEAIISLAFDNDSLEGVPIPA